MGSAEARVNSRDRLSVLTILSRVADDADNSRGRSAEDVAVLDHCVETAGHVHPEWRATREIAFNEEPVHHRLRGCRLEATSVGSAAGHLGGQTRDGKG